MEAMSFGSDPEFILFDANGRPKSAIGILGRKASSARMFYDNVLAECEVEPSICRDGSVENVRRSLKELASAVNPMRLGNVSSCVFPESEMIHKDARLAGCSPEMCAYELSFVPPSKVKRMFKKTNFRTAGGHIHIGTLLGRKHEDCVMLVRMLDLFLGVSELIMDCCPKSSERRRLYGGAGRYRQPSHGVEYRTPGNFWVRSPRTVELFFDICSMVVQFVSEGFHRKFWNVDENLLDSDEFWNSGGNPAHCHSCHGYDHNMLRRMFSMERHEALREGREIVSLSLSAMDSRIKSRIMETKQTDIHKSWGLE